MSFIQALAQKIRFSGLGKGVLTTEDLFDLPVETLNQAALERDALIAQSGQQGYLRTKTAANSGLQLQRDVIVAVLQFKLDQQDAAVANRSLTQQQQELAELIHAKKQQARANKSLEELQAEYDALTAGK